MDRSEEGSSLRRNVVVSNVFVNCPKEKVDSTPPDHNRAIFSPRLIIAHNEADSDMFWQCRVDLRVPNLSPQLPRGRVPMAARAVLAPDIVKA